MTKPRKYQIDLDRTTIYHIVCTCVRHAWLCGYDTKNNKSYEYRRRRIVARMHTLASIFFIDLLEHNVLSNHYHIIIDVMKKRAQKASRAEVVRRYYAISNAQRYPAAKKWFEGQMLSETEYEQAMRDIEFFRERLCSISWFMQNLNQPIALEANQEEGMQSCSFWDKRYYSQGIYSQHQKLKCMIYVALNTVHAGIDSKPEQAPYSGLFERINHQLTDSQTLYELGMPDFKTNRLDQYNLPVDALQPFIDNQSSDDDRGIEFSFYDYCELVDATARIKREDKSHYLDPKAQSIFQRLNMDSRYWLDEINYFEPKYFARGQIQRAKKHGPYP